MLTVTQRLFRELNASNIRYCHWKSNISLEHALAHGGELDLLVDHRDVSTMEAVLVSLGFKQAVDPYFDIPSTQHFFGFDEETGKLLNVHVYYRLITGDNLTKNYWLPVEPVLLQNIRSIGSVPVPTKAAELLLFIPRIYLKQGSLLRLLLMQRDLKTVKDELRWLAEDGAPMREALGFLSDWLPSLDPVIFQKCVRALASDRNRIWRRFLLARQIRSRLRIYRRHTGLRRALISTILCLKLLWTRFVVRRKPRYLRSGGAVIAFVGPEATGKSTLVREIHRWLGQKLSAVAVHSGKPPSSWLMLPSRLLLAVMSRLSPSLAASGVQEENPPLGNVAGNQGDRGLLYMWRALTVARNRRNLLMKAARMCANGTLVVCDRYPSSRFGAMDSPRLRVSNNGFKSRLARMEHILYKQIPPPDLVIQLVAPIEVAVQRNALRQKHDKESEDYVRRRHAEEAIPLYPPPTGVTRIDTDQPLEEVIRATKRVVWNFL